MKTVGVVTLDGARHAHPGAGVFQPVPTTAVPVAPPPVRRPRDAGAGGLLWGAPVFRGQFEAGLVPDLSAAVPLGAPGMVKFSFGLFGCVFAPAPPPLHGYSVPVR